MKPACERCGVALPAARSGARICSFECTFCAACADDPLKGSCPNCGGELQPRPTRSEDLLERYPPSA